MIYSRLLQAITLYAFYFFIWSCSNTTRSMNYNPLVGNWKIDSVGFGRDSNLVDHFILSSMMEDSMAMDFTFVNDSLFIQMENETDTVLYHINQNKHLVVIGDIPGEKYGYTIVNDSSITLQQTNGTIIFLKKLSATPVSIN